MSDVCVFIAEGCFLKQPNLPSNQKRGFEMSASSGINRRSFLQTMGSVGLLGTLPESAFASHAGSHVVHEIAAPSQGADAKPAHSINFAVCGMSHDHIYGMIDAIQRGGGVMVAAYATEPDKIAMFRKHFPGVKMVSSEEEILNDPSIQLVMSSKIASERAALGIRAMLHGKDFLSDKPGITTLVQLAEVRKTIAATKRIYAIMYSELLEVKAAVKAGELVQSGAIGRVIQTINIAPHQIVQSGGGTNGGGSVRPDWFWNPDQYGGIFVDIGSHQVDQFLYYTGSTHAEIAESQIANINHPQHPQFQDFGDMVLRGNKGFGYVRLDWFTPDGLGTWGDGRLFILGTKGYIEVRKYTNVAVSHQGNNLFIVDDKQSRYIDCNNLTLPFGPAFVSDILNRTHTAQDQTQALLAAELVITAQRNARVVHLDA
jgi:predicted dehydrogenase